MSLSGSLVDVVVASALVLAWLIGFVALVRPALSRRRAGFAGRELRKLRPVSTYHLRQINGEERGARS